MQFGLYKIKRLILKGNYKFTDKAETEMYATNITRTDVLEAIVNAFSIDKIMKSISPGKTHRGEKVYVIKGVTYDNIPIYTKGAIKQFNGRDILYILISAKREGIL
ncbi:MAG TPA: hypothetical protein DD708_07195 [Deltaproteobacteria bacterium]|nr:MAG: hypothetical protein A3G92_05720 [Deltaproteobacteria bacterium RIFCSPLOWO2_12_FULL_38_8]HBQ21704.1 hypothetical protein [Deltaproteobacteria bacterium]